MSAERRRRCSGSAEDEPSCLGKEGACVRAYTVVAGSRPPCIDMQKKTYVHMHARIYVCILANPTPLLSVRPSVRPSVRLRAYLVWSACCADDDATGAEPG